MLKPNHLSSGLFAQFYTRNRICIRPRPATQVRGRWQAGSFGARTAADTVCCTLVQVVQTNAIRLHAQSGPRAALETGSGLANPIASTAATQPSDTMAIAKAKSLRVHGLWGMATFLFTGGE
jgi:hypothetical protein